VKLPFVESSIGSGLDSHKWDVVKSSIYFKSIYKKNGLYTWPNENTGNPDYYCPNCGVIALHSRYGLYTVAPRFFRWLNLTCNEIIIYKIL